MVYVLGSIPAGCLKLRLRSLMYEMALALPGVELGSLGFEPRTVPLGGREALVVAEKSADAAQEVADHLAGAVAGQAAAAGLQAALHRAVVMLGLLRLSSPWRRRRTLLPAEVGTLGLWRVPGVIGLLRLLLEPPSEGIRLSKRCRRWWLLAVALILRVRRVGRRRLVGELTHLARVLTSGHKIIRGKEAQEAKKT